MTLAIAIPEGPAWTQRVRLDGAYYTIAGRWNERTGAWVLDIGDSSGVLHAAGVPIRLGVDLLGQVQDVALPPGILIAIDSQGGAAEAGRLDLGERVSLLYVSADEVAAIRASA